MRMDGMRAKCSGVVYRTMLPFAGLLVAGQVRAATFVQYTLEGPGTIVTATQAPYPGTFIYSDPVYGEVFLSFVVDTSQYSTSSTTGLYPNLSTVTATAMGMGLTATGSDTSAYRYRTSFEATAMFAGYGSGFPTALASSNAAGSFTITQSAGINPVFTYLSASVTKVSITPVPMYVNYAFGVVPDPPGWATLIAGLGAVGAAMRYRRRSFPRIATA